MHQQTTTTTTYQPTFLNFTHPPPTIIEQPLPSIDDSTIEQFLIDRNHLTIQTDKAMVINHFKIDGRDRLNVIQMNVNNLIKQQRLEETNLKNDIAQLSPLQWTEKLNSLNRRQIKIAELLTKFETLTSALTKATTNNVKRKRRTKRKPKKVTQRHIIQESTKEAEGPAKQSNFEVDLEESYEKYEVDRLRTANLKRMNECKKQLAFLDSLIELRSIRRKNSNASGSGQNSNEKCFAEQIDQLKNKWTEALTKSNAQDKDLKMLQTNTSSKLWSNALFSDAEPTFVVDETMDFQKLLDIR